MCKLMAVACCLVLLGTIIAACGGGGGQKEDAKGSTNNSASADNHGSGQSSGQSSGQQEETPEEVTISIYYPLPDQTEARRLEDDKIRRFQEKYPHVNIVKSDWHYSIRR